MFHFILKKKDPTTYNSITHKMYKPKKNKFNRTGKRSGKPLLYSDRAQFEQILIFNTINDLKCLKILILLRHPRNEV